MISIIVAFPKLEQAKSIKSILARGGYPGAVACTSGARVLQSANELRDGIVICGGRLADMVCAQLRQDLPSHFQMLLLAPAAVCAQEAAEGVAGLTMPLKVQALLEAVRRMEDQIARERRGRRKAPAARSAEEEQLIARAKALLMEQKGLSEQEAHRYIQKVSMDSGVRLTEAAQMALCVEGSQQQTYGNKAMGQRSEE